MLKTEKKCKKRQLRDLTPGQKVKVTQVPNGEACSSHHQFDILDLFVYMSNLQRAIFSNSSQCFKQFILTNKSKI